MILKSNTDNQHDCKIPHKHQWDYKQTWACVQRASSPVSQGSRTLEWPSAGLQPLWRPERTSQTGETGVWLFKTVFCDRLLNIQNRVRMFKCDSNATLEDANVTAKVLTNHFGELLRYFRGVGVFWGAHSQWHHHKDLEELLLLELNEVSLQGAVARTAFQRRLDVNWSPRAS